MYASHLTSCTKFSERLSTPPLLFRLIFNGTIKFKFLLAAVAPKEGTSIAPTSHPRSILIPERIKSATKVAAISLSKPIFIRACFGLLSRIKSVTSLHPKFEKILANSIATIPLPVITRDFGKKFNPLMESESNTRVPSKGILVGRNGLDPVAINTLSVVIVWIPIAFGPVGVIVKQWVPPLSLNFAYPSTKVTPAYSSCRFMSRAL
mmetsp:Transcript_3769/g.8119  ORF Transcript_3769/g.8119 Transcript_3769/m.8119 type:complete len:207 (-) Transcript_3769:895-1515(-)